MIIEKILLYNFKKYKKSDIVFKKGIMGIFGHNGAGKSTIFDGITWALYGKTQSTDVSGVNQEDLIRDGEERMGVELLFSLGTTKCRVSRYLDNRGTNTKLWADNKVQATKTREVGTLVERMLGLDAKAFVASSFIRQKEIDLLSSKTPSRRRGIINRLFNLRVYEKFEKEAKQKKKVEKEERNTLFGKQEIFTREIEPISDLRKEEKTLKKELDIFSSKYKKFKDNLKNKEEKIEKLEKKKEIYDENLKKKEILSEKLRSKKERLKALNKDLNGIKSAEKEYKKKIPEYKEYKKIKHSFKRIEAKRDEYTELKNQLEIERNAFKANLTNARSNIEKMEKNLERSAEKIKNFEKKIEKLPEIRKKIEVYKEIKPGIERCENSIEKIRKKIGSIEQQLTRHETEKNSFLEDLREIEGVGIGKKCPLCKRELDGAHYATLTAEYRGKIKEKDKDISKVSKKRERARELLDETRSNLNELKSDLRDLEKLRERENKLSVHESDIKRLRKEIKTIKKDMKQLEKEKKDLTDKKNQKIKKIKKNIKEIGFNENEYIRTKKKLEDKEEIGQEISVLQEKISRKEEIEETISAVENEIKTIEGSIRGLSKVLEGKKEVAEEYTALKKKIERLREQYIEISKKYTAKSTELKSLQGRIEELRKKRKELKSIEIKIKQKKGKEREYSILSEAFSSIPVSIQNRLKPRIALETSQLVNEMTDGKYSEIELDEDYGVFVGSGNEMHPVFRFSGGERDLINLCLRIAISRVLVSLSSEHGFSHIQSLFLDEGFSSLDAGRRQNLLKTLNKLRNQFGQILIITHVEDIKRSVPNAIYVEETAEGYSSVERV
ncbi:MAG: SMC family ATPase [Euryarchaeota archaeon]|nr:SMC family ATPase [Euryarchaeota archaeon]